MHQDCEIIIVMGKSDPDNPARHLQQSQILVPMNTPGVTVVRNLRTLGYDDAPLGHGEILFKNVRVPVENMLLGEGRGFEIAQGRLGPGRIHHCMRLIGSAQRALELACERVNSRYTFGRRIGEHQSVRENIAKSFAEIEQARLLTPSPRRLSTQLEPPLPPPCACTLELSPGHAPARRSSRSGGPMSLSRLWRLPC